jgi:hypothetical protein
VSKIPPGGNDRFRNGWKYISSEIKKLPISDNYLPPNNLMFPNNGRICCCRGFKSDAITKSVYLQGLIKSTIKTQHLDSGST